MQIKGISMSKKKQYVQLHDPRYGAEIQYMTSKRTSACPLVVIASYTDPPWRQDPNTSSSTGLSLKNST